MFILIADCLCRIRQILEPHTVLVIVDTNRPSMTECEELLTMTSSIVVLDHHRQSNDKISKATLSYVEPYASSACEMVAEIMQYVHENLRIRAQEADVLYGGIVVDTNNFQSRSSVRTFEAAAYLKRNGADAVRVRKMFREELTACQRRAEAVAGAELFNDAYAIALCPSEGLTAPTVVAAQAANELLDIENVKASFVMTEYEDRVYISARSIDEVNVQLIMERLGGGGHMNIAGTQLKDHSADEARQLLKNTILDMRQTGDI